MKQPPSNLSDDLNLKHRRKQSANIYLYINFTISLRFISVYNSKTKNVKRFIIFNDIYLIILCVRVCMCVCVRYVSMFSV